MSRSRLLVISSVFVISIAAGFYLFRAVGSGSLVDATEVEWRTLGDLDYISGKATPDLQSLDGKTVKIPGFMVPLEDNSKSVAQFLLVPSPQACVHVPPPPPNQMVLVDMEAGHEAKVEFGPIWIYGVLHLHSKRHMYGESSFQLTGVAVEPYK